MAESYATLSLLLEVRGKRILDVGCGLGVYAEWLADRGMLTRRIRGKLSVPWSRSRSAA